MVKYIYLSFHYLHQYNGSNKWASQTFTFANVPVEILSWAFINLINIYFLLTWSYRIYYSSNFPSPKSVI